MATYILDTGIVLGYLRGAGYADYAERQFSVSTPPNMTAVSIVTLGEMHSLCLQLGWGEDRRKTLIELMKSLPRVDISSDQIIERYAEIDAYSQAKYTPRGMPSVSSPRNMGKNDIWISATGSVINATLLTTDKDFNHLNGIFLKVEYIDQSFK